MERTGTEADTASHDGRLEGLVAEAQAAVSYSANSLRAIRERFRTAHADEVARWERLRDDLVTVDRRPRQARPGGGGGETATDDSELAAIAAEAGAEDARIRVLRRDEAVVGREVGAGRATLSRIELAIRSLENVWLFLGHEDDSLIVDDATPASAEQLQMRIVEAQEAERSRLAREVHDGPAQALANAIFQVEVVERMLDREEALARAELRLLREILRRVLTEVRADLSQLRPPLLDDVGLAGAIRDAAEQVSSVLGIPVTVDVADGIDRVDDGVQTVILRVVQEALQNVRKHAAATRVAVTVSNDGDEIVAEIRDDGRGFDADTVAARGRRNFGLQFMRERAELIGARFEVRSRPDGGTVVRIAVPAGERRSDD